MSGLLDFDCVGGGADAVVGDPDGVTLIVILLLSSQSLPTKTLAGPIVYLPVLVGKSVKTHFENHYHLVQLYY